MSEVTPLRVSGTSALAAQADDETQALRTEANGLLEYAKGIRVIDARGIDAVVAEMQARGEKF